MVLKHIKAKRMHILVLFPLAGYAMGWKLDNMEIERLTLFRDKSALFGRELGPDEKPSWP